MLCGLLRPDSGRIDFDGAPMGPAAPGPADDGRVAQATAIWEMLTPFEQLAFLGQMYDLTPAAAGRERRR